MGEKENVNENQRNKYLDLAKSIYELRGGDKRAGAWKILVEDTAFQALVKDWEFTKSFLNFISPRRTLIRPAVWRKVFIPLCSRWEELFPQENLAAAYPGLSGLSLGGRESRSMTSRFSEIGQELKAYEVSTIYD